MLFRVSLTRKTPEGHCADDWTLLLMRFCFSFLLASTGQLPMEVLAILGRGCRAYDAKLGSYRLGRKIRTC